MPDANPRAVAGNNNPPSMLEVPTEALLKTRHAPLFARLKSWKAKAAKLDLQPKTLEDCVKLDMVYREGADLANDADGEREKEKKPFFEAGKLVDSVFNLGIRDEIGVKGGTAGKILQAAADKRLAITRAAQAKQAEEAEAARKEAARIAEMAKRQDDSGKVKQADVNFAKAEGVERLADQLEAAAVAPVAEASKTKIGGVSSSVKAKLVCTGVVRAELDLNSLRPYLKQEALVDAVNLALKMEAFTELTGAAIIEQAVGSVRR